MFLLKLSLSYLNDSEIPAGLSRGVLFSHYLTFDKAEDLYSQEVLEKPYYDKEFPDLDFLTFTGAFCAKNSGEHKFQLHGKGGFWFRGGLFDEASGKKECGSGCGGVGLGHDCDVLKVNLKKGTCYPFSFDVCTGSGWIYHPYRIRTSFAGSDLTVWDDYVQNTNKYHCMKGYYGATCEKCTAECGPYGYCGGSERSSQSLDRCTCTNSYVSQDPFCRDMTARPQTGSIPGLSLELIENHGDGATVVTSVVGASGPIGALRPGEPYARARLSGAVFAPQKSKYALRVRGTGSGIGSVSLKGAFNGLQSQPQYLCEPSKTKDERVVATAAVDAVAGELMALSVEVHTECALEELGFEVEWCFFRQFEDRDIAVDINNDSFWEPVPYIYLFH